MSHFLIVGQSFSGLTEYLKSHGHDYTVLQDVKKTKYPDKKMNRRVVTRFDDRDTLLACVEPLRGSINAAISVYENYILPTAWINEHLGLPGLPVRSAEACTDKEVMRTMFAAAPEKISPEFAVITTEQDLRDFASRHSFPLIIKPANLAKSLLVTKSMSLDELMINYRETLKILQSTYDTYAPNRTPKLIVEEFLVGPVHSVDAFVDQDGQPLVLEQVVDYQTGYDVGYDDNFHYSRLLPSQLSPSDQEALRHCASVGIKALNMKSSPAHVEIIMTSIGPRIVEIGARNGGYRERMHRLSNGIDITGCALQVALGHMPTIETVRNDSCAVIELFPKTPGKFMGIEHLEELRQLNSLQYLSVKAEPGKYVGLSRDGYKACAIIILHTANRVQFDHDVSFIRDNIVVQTK